MRIRAVVAAIAVVALGGGAAQALPVSATNDAPYGCAGVDPVGGVCVDSPVDSVDDVLGTVGGLLG